MTHSKILSQLFLLHSARPNYFFRTYILRLLVLTPLKFGEHMKKLITSALCLAAVALSANSFAETWIARCNGMQFNFNRTGKSALFYMNTSTGIYQIATGKIIFDNGIAMRAPITGNSPGYNGLSLTDIGLNKDRKNVYVLYRHPQTGEVKDGVFCNSEIQVVN